MKKSVSGFTIVELLIVIVVIAILAAISVVSYSAVQSRARDTLRENAATQVVKAYQMLKVQTGQTPGETGYGWSASNVPGTGNGHGFTFFNYQTNGSTANLFIEEGLLGQDFLQSTPKNTAYGNSVAYAFMTYPCADGKRWALYYYVENSSPETDQEYQNRLRDCRNSPTFNAFGSVEYTSYKMRKIRFIQ